ncbi:MAG TPA: MFS transporter [Ideonella sp.]|uniref:MFS transporter n=1 Tax=Ideonella sp. TaxID=1929293 RepID=UPI002C66A060|nr:MFS transporter [Ideonella sp.]HSI52021.1 MFS transporter [Ideonella sp.]
MSLATAAAPPLPGWRAGLAYGGLGLPLAFVALPLYVVLPEHYARSFGVPLASLGALLLLARAGDAVIDPLIGRGMDRLLRRPPRDWAPMALAAALLLAASFHGLFFPPVRGSPALLAWCALMLAGCYLAYSALSVLHQAWGASLGGDEAQRARVVAWREGLGLLGVITASLLAGVSLQWTSAVLAATLAAGLIGLSRAPRPQLAMAAPEAAPSLLAPLRHARFRRLLGVYLLNGMASAIAATLVLFFIRDRLQAPALAPLFLGAYFLAAALSLPLWVRGVKWLGLAGCWALGMGLAVLSFLGAVALGAGDTLAYGLICVASGVALGADLSVPPALLAGLLREAGLHGRSEGAWFGWWQLCTKLNLALAAGVALPLLQALGYAPGHADAAAGLALASVYGVLPCVLKTLAGLLLWHGWLRKKVPECLPA